MPEALKHDLRIARIIRQKIRAGVAISVILDEIKQYEGAPISFTGLYSTYRNDIAEARSSIHEEIGSVVVKAALDGDLKAAELFLRSRAGWSPTQTVVEATPEDTNEQSGAIDDLLALLGRNKKEE